MLILVWAYSLYSSLTDEEFFFPLQVRENMEDGDACQEQPCSSCVIAAPGQEHGIANHYHNEMTSRLSHHYTPMTPASIIHANYKFFINYYV